MAQSCYPGAAMAQNCYPGAAIGSQNTRNDHAVVYGQPVTHGQPAGHVVMGVPYRVSFSESDETLAKKMPWLEGFPDKSQAGKIEAIRDGGEAALKHALLPDERRCHDTCWMFPFAAVLLAGVGFCIRYASSDILHVDFGTVDYPTVGEIVLVGVVGGLASLITASCFLQLAKTSPACVVWTSLLFGPTFCIIVGIVLMVLGGGAGPVLLGLAFCLCGALSLCCVFICWRHLIPFMIKMVEVVATIVQDNPTMLAVSLLGSALGIVWALVMGLAFYGLHAEFYEANDSHNEGTRETGVGYFLYFVVCFVFVWGGMVAKNLVHVTYCGVFGRWYLNKDDGVRLRKSLIVAIGPAFGSICLGSFLIAVIRALEYTVRAIRMDQAEDGNIACCIILLVVECIISCIGDFMEYFSEWAYVQVALRACSFCQAVKITYSMCSCANVTYIIQDLLLDSVVNMGAMLCAAVGTLAGGLVGFALGSSEKAMAGFFTGFFAGIICGATAVNVISSGVKTILSLWAETPHELEVHRPDIHKEFDDRLKARFE